MPVIDEIEFEVWFEKFQKIKMDSCDDLNLLTYLFEKYELKNLADYGRANNISPQGVLKRKAKNKQPYITLAGADYYFN